MNVSLKFVKEDGTNAVVLTCPAVDFDGKPIASLEIHKVSLCGHQLDWSVMPLVITPGQKIVIEFDMPPKIADAPSIVDRRQTTRPDQTDLGASDDRPLGPDHPVYRG